VSGIIRNRKMKKKSFKKSAESIQSTGLLKPGKLASVLYHLPNFIKLYWSLFWDKRAPKLPKILLVAAIIYFVSPLDFIPDIAIPGLGYLDDLAVLAIAVRYFIKLMPRELIEEKVAEIDGKSE